MLVAFGVTQLKIKKNESPLSFEASGDSAATTVSINSRNFVVEIAQTEEEKAQGLSGRSQLGTNNGMLFVFDPPTIPSFWMREMNFALDFVWIDENLRVIDLTKNVPVPAAGTRLQDLPRYSPTSEVKYVLEINAGQTDSILIGDSVVIRNTDFQ